MHFKFKHIQKIIGGFFILTCIIILILLVVVARGERWFQSYQTYTSYFNSAGGLHDGSLVIIHGLEAGKIGRVFLDEKNSVKVDVRVFSKYADRIREGSTVKIVSPIVGSASLEVLLGSKDNDLIPKGDVIPSKFQDSAGLDELIENTNELISQLKNPEGDLMKTLDNVNVATKGLSDAMTKNDSTLRMLMEKRELYDELVSSTKHLDSLLEMLDNQKPDIRDAITEARRGLEEVNKVVLALQKSVFLRGNMQEYLKEDVRLTNDGRGF